jgi:hypothetical protein
MMGNPLKKLLIEVFEGLDRHISEHNQHCNREGGINIEKQTLKIVGQTALFLAELPFPLTSTTDLDVLIMPPYSVQVKLRELLSSHGMSLDPDGRLIWMPKNTKYQRFFDSKWVEGLYADPESIMLSKFKFNRPDDRKLIRDYEQYYPGFAQAVEKAGLKRKK